MDRRGFLRSAAGVVALASAERLFAADIPSGDIQALRGDGAKVGIDRNSLQNLRDSLRGALLLPGDAGYDQARLVIDRSIDKHPALIVQPTGAADVRTAVDFARSHALLLAVKCGGHSGFRSTCDGGMQIDLSRFRGVRVDPERRVAQVSGGCLLGDVDHESMACGLVTPAGVVSHTGVGGLTLGAGFGRLQRRFGLTIDNVRAVDIVTADGLVQRAEAEKNAFLFGGCAAVAGTSGS
jgi:FAD/FMN-containing dehydrogenase